MECGARMKKTSKLMFIFFVLSILVLSSVVTINSKSSGKEFEVIIKYKDSSGMEKALKEGSLSGKSAKESIMLLNNEITKSKLSKKNYNRVTKIVTEEEYEQLKNSPDVEYVQKNHKLHAFLQDSVPLIQADDSWRLLQNNINLSGKGQSVCVIDSGINYSRADFGGCTINETTISGNDVAQINQSAHDYPNSSNPLGAYSYNLTITAPGFTNIAVHFVNISTQDGIDSVDIYNSTGSLKEEYYGLHTNVWSPSVNGDTIEIRIWADNAISDYGFYIDKILNGTSSTVYDWDNCDRVIYGYDFLNYDEDPYDDEGHGTHVTGIAAARGGIYGVAPDSNVIALKVVNRDGDAYNVDILDALQWCTDNSEDYNISVISMSLGGGQNYTYCDAENSGYASKINAAVAKNISVVIATGNTAAGYPDPLLGVAVPACVTNATRVTATEKADNVFASYAFRNSNFSDILAAPGTNINSTVILSQGASGYGLKSGTSMATPHVSGAIAIINQYLKATGQKKTPQQIETVLANTGTKIYDASSGLNYSRIDLYAALLSLDNQAPNVTLVSPNNGILDEDANQTFRCNATDWQLKNLTFYLWNSSGLVYNSTTAISGTANESEFNRTLANTTYTWNCKACDNASNCAFASSNRTLGIGAMAVTLNLPSATTEYRRDSNSNTTFNCSAQTADDLSLKNITLQIFTSGLIYNTTKNFTGTSNSTTFYYDFTTEGTYKWNCLAYDNESNFAYASSNKTLTYDETSPEVTLESPEDEDSSYEEDEEITFEYEVTDNLGIANCTLLIDDDEEETDTSVSNNTNQEFDYDGFSSDGEYEWTVECFDRAGNSDEDTFIIDIQAADEGGGGGSSSGTNIISSSATSTTSTDTTDSSDSSSSSTVVNTKDDGDFSPTPAETKKSYTQEVKEGRKIIVVLEVTKETNTSGTLETITFNESHSITVAEITEDSVILTIASDPINLTLSAGEDKKLNITSAEYYDLYIRLNNITIENSSERASLTVKTIHQPTSGFFSRIWAFCIWHKTAIFVVFGVIALIILTILAQYYVLKRRGMIRTREFSRYESHHLQSLKHRHKN